jgi:putative sterol carrier protein
MAKYLSQEWFDEFVSLAQDQPGRPGATLKVQYRTTGGPEGDLEYHWVLEDGKLLAASLGPLADAECTVTSTYEDAAKIQQGELEPTAAFMQGKMRVSGNMAKMMALMPITTSPEWKELQDKVQAMTEY